MTLYNLLMTVCDKCSLTYFVDDRDAEDRTDPPLLDFSKDEDDPECTPIHCPRCMHVQEVAVMNVEVVIDDEHVE